MDNKINKSKVYFDRYLAKKTGQAFTQTNTVNTSIDVINEPRPLKKIF